MKSRWHVFNVFLTVATIGFLAGCVSTSEESKKKKQLSNVRVHVETDRSSDQTSSISVLRSAPMKLNIEREPILDENNVTAAAVVDQPDGTYAIQLTLDRRGSWILERTTVSHRSKHLAIFSFFGDTRWLAAPLIIGKNSTGMLTFTPDASREECDRIVRGLNNVAAKLNRKENWPFDGPLDK
jgi:hypothetical protein